MPKENQSNSKIILFLEKIDSIPFLSSKEFETTKKKASKSKFEEMKQLSGKDTLPKDILFWLNSTPEDSEEISEIISRILIYVSPSKNFEQQKIHHWFRRGKLPRSAGGTNAATMAYLFSDIVRANKLSTRISNLRSRIERSDRKSKRSKRPPIAAEKSEAQLDELIEKQKVLNATITRKLSEVQAILGSGGMI